MRKIELVRVDLMQVDPMRVDPVAILLISWELISSVIASKQKQDQYGFNKIMDSQLMFTLVELVIRRHHDNTQRCI